LRDPSLGPFIALCMKLEKGAAFNLLVQEQHLFYHSSQPCQIIDCMRGQTRAYPSLVGLELSKELKDVLDELEDKNVETEQNTKTLIQADAHVF
jgi:hypothetical protein